MLVRYVRAYQEVQPLTIGELWAVSITLRIVLVENLGRLARADYAKPRGAHTWRTASPTVCSGPADDPPSPSPSSSPPTSARRFRDAFAVQLVHRLRDQDPRITPALTWLDQRLAIQDTTAETVVRDVHRRQGASNVTVRNIITSLRLISDVDWQRLFERLSLVDVVFAAGGAFEEMDFPTRTLYRSAVEELARGSKRTELDIAGAAALAASRERHAEPTAEQARRGDPGYHLLARRPPRL